MARTEKTKYIIIGNSAGGIGGAEAIRELDKTGTITIISDEPYPAYSRPLISEYLAHHYPLERMLYRPADFYEKNSIRTILGEKVAELDVNNHRVKLASGQSLSWQKLLLATGGVPIVPKMPGGDLKGVFTFTKLDDAKAIDEFLTRSRTKVKAIVIGGGLIGISVTEALVKRGVDVSIVEMKDRILNVLLDEEGSALEEKALKQAGVEIITGHTVSKINSYLPGEVTSVTLDNGQPIPCHMVIVAIGVQPRLELIGNTGIKTNRGVVVDRQMSTSQPDVYACGDVVEAYDFVYGVNRLAPVWPNAYLGGRIAGLNMAGVPTEYQGGTAINSMKYFGINTVSAGMVMPPDNTCEVISSKRQHIYKKLVLKDGVIVGMIFSGDIEKSGIIYSLMKDRVKVDRFKQVLVSDDFGLASLPEVLWRPKLPAPIPATASRSASIEPPEEMLVGE